MALQYKRQEADDTQHKLRGAYDIFPDFFCTGI